MHIVYTWKSSHSLYMYIFHSQPPEAQDEFFFFFLIERFPSGSVGNNLPAMQETQEIQDREVPWVRKIPLRRKWHPTPVFLPVKTHRQRSLAGYSPKYYKKLDTTEVTEHTNKKLKTKEKAAIINRHRYNYKMCTEVSMPFPRDRLYHIYNENSKPLQNLLKFMIVCFHALDHLSTGSFNYYKY